MLREERILGELSKVICFDWDKGNIDKNWKKHKVSFKECEEVFTNQSLLLNLDRKHSRKEIRFQALGKTNKERRLYLVFTIRNKKIRVISSRDQNKKERRRYEKT